MRILREGEDARQVRMEEIPSLPAMLHGRSLAVDTGQAAAHRRSHPEDLQN